MKSLFSKERIIYYILGLILILIFFPLFKFGHFFSLDFVFNPNGWIPNFGDNLYWVGILSVIFSKVGISIIVLEKIVFLIAILLPIYGTYLLVKGVKNNYALFFGLVFIIVNPFFYERFIDGQVNVLLSLSMFPLFLYFLKNTFETLDLKNMIMSSLLSLLLCLTSIHNIFFILIIGIIFFLVYGEKDIRYIKRSIVFGGFVIILNLFRILPTVFLKGDNVNLFNQINNFDTSHNEAFATYPGNIGIYNNLLSLHGYWGEGEKRFLATYGENQRYLYMFLIILAIVIIGIYARTIKNKEGKQFEYSLLILMGISYILALGISQNNIFSGINQFLYTHLPFYEGFREPHKRAIFLLIGYVYFGTFGVKYIYDVLKKKLDNFSLQVVGFTMCLLPILYSPFMIYWLSTQVKIKDYPSEWYEIQSTINNNITNCTYKAEKLSNRCYSTLFLPWHGYMSIQWIGKTVGGWIAEFFGNNVLFADTIEIRNIYTASSRSESKIVEKHILPLYISKENTISDLELQEFIYDMKGLGIKNIILVKEADFTLYKVFLDQLIKKNLIQIEKENDMAVSYKIM